MHLSKLERKAEREELRDLPPTGTLSKGLQWQGLAQPEIGSQGFIWVSHVDDRGPCTWVIFCVFSRCICREIETHQAARTRTETST